MRRLATISVSLISFIFTTSLAEAVPAFTYHAPGVLAAGAGRTGDRTIYFPNMRFPLGAGPADGGAEAFANSQIHPISSPENSVKNYVYPWQDTYCEERQWDMALCPGKHGHQGVDIRPQSPLDKTWPAFAMADGIVIGLTRFSVLTIRSTEPNGDAYSCRYMHMDYASILAAGLKVGDHVKLGQLVGKVSDIMDGIPNTSIHLHFDCSMIIGGVTMRPPVFTSLIQAYRKAWGLSSLDVNGQLSVDNAREVP